MAIPFGPPQGDETVRSEIGWRRPEEEALDTLERNGFTQNDEKQRRGDAGNIANEGWGTKRDLENKPVEISTQTTSMVTSSEKESITANDYSVVSVSPSNSPARKNNKKKRKKGKPARNKKKKRKRNRKKTDSLPSTTEHAQSVSPSDSPARKNKKKKKRKKGKQARNKKKKRKQNRKKTDSLPSTTEHAQSAPSTPALSLQPTVLIGGDNIFLVPTSSDRSISIAPSASPFSVSRAPSVSNWPTLSPTITPKPIMTHQPSLFTPPLHTRPTNPAWSTDGGISPAGSDENGAQDATTVVVVMAVAVLCALCCGYNRGYAEADSFKDGVTAAREFREDIMKSKIFVLDVRPGQISDSCCCSCFPCCETKTVPHKRITKAYFFTTRIKRRWKPLLTYIQFILGWMSFATTLVGLFAPTNKANSIIGFGVLFLSELVLHLWYGYLRYPNIARWFFHYEDKDDGLFEDMRYLFGILYHNGDAETGNESSKYIDCVCALFVVVLHLGTIIGIFVTSCICGILQAAGDDDKKRKRKRNDAESIVPFAVLVGALVGSFAYPLIFLVATTPLGIIVASSMHHVVQEYYEAKLFCKTFKEFVQSTFTKSITDFVGVEELGGFDEAFDRITDGLTDELKEDLGELNSLKNDLTEAQEDFEEELDARDLSKEKTSSTEKTPFGSSVSMTTYPDGTVQVVTKFADGSMKTETTVPNRNESSV